MVPVRVLPTCAFEVSVMNAGPDDVNVIASPSGSVALIPWSAVAPAATDMFAIAANVGGPGTLLTVIVSDFSSLRLPSLARTVAWAVPASKNPGARWMLPVPVPVPGVTVVTVIYAGPATFENVRASPSGSVPVIAWSAVAPSSTVMIAGCAKVGAKSGAATTFVASTIMSVRYTSKPTCPAGTSGAGQLSS